MAVRNVISEVGSDAEKLAFIKTDYGIGLCATAFVQLMQSPQHPTVVICANNVLDAGALNQARTPSNSFPEDVFITGLDDFDLARIILPKPTTFSTPQREMGRKITQTVVHMVEGGLLNIAKELDVSLETR